MDSTSFVIYPELEATELEVRFSALKRYLCSFYFSIFDFDFDFEMYFDYTRTHTCLNNVKSIVGTVIHNNKIEHMDFNSKNNINNN